MKYTITSDKQERFHIAFSREVSNVTGLRMAPGSLEEELQHGEWLILVFAIWDAKDHPAIDIACQIATSLKSTRVAVRPFESPAEFASWAPELAGHRIAQSVSESTGDEGKIVSIVSAGDDHPMWLLFRNGRLARAAIGIRTLDLVREVLSESLN